MKINKLVLVLSFLLLSLGLHRPVWAAPGASAVVTANKRNVILRLSGLRGLQSVSYDVVYVSRGKEEGISGVIRKPKTTSATRTFFMGTCSKKACTAHRNITKGTVTVRFKDAKGVSTTKTIALKF